MAFDLDAITALTLHKLGLPADDQMVQPANLYLSINTGLKAMATDYDWPWLMTSEAITTIAGTSVYALPANHVRTLFIADNARETNLIARQRQDLVRYASKTGPPIYYTVYGTAVRLAPVPDTVTALDHVFIQFEPVLVDGDDQPLCPEHFGDLIAVYAAYEECTRLKDFSQRNAFAQDIAAWKQRMKDNVRQEASTLRIRARSDWAV